MKFGATCITPVADFKLSATCALPIIHSVSSISVLGCPFFPKFINFFGRGQDNVRFIFCGSFCLSLSLFFDIIGNGYESLVLPHKVSESLQSNAPKEVVDKLLHNLKLSDASLEDPKPETEKWIRCLTRDAKNHGRTDVVEYLRGIMPEGTAGKQAGTVGGSNTRFRTELKHKKSLKKSFILHSKWKLDRIYPENGFDLFFACEITSSLEISTQTFKTSEQS